MPKLPALTQDRVRLKDEIDSLNKKLSELKSTLNDIDDAILGEMSEQGLDRIALEGVTISATTQTFYKAIDWADFDRFAAENQLTHLYQRRLTQAAVAEALNLNPDLPVETATKRSLSVRKL